MRKCSRSGPYKHDKGECNRYHQDTEGEEKYYLIREYLIRSVLKYDSGRYLEHPERLMFLDSVSRIHSEPFSDRQITKVLEDEHWKFGNEMLK